MIPGPVKRLLKRPSVSRRLARALLRLDQWSYHKLNTLLMHAEGGIHPKHRLMNYAQFFLDNVRAQDRVLDVGCGRGTVAWRVASKAASVLGVDLEPKNIEIARRLYQRPNLRYEIRDATEAEFKERFDAVILSNVLEHIEYRDAFLRSMSRLAPKLLIRVPMIDRDWRVLMKKEWGLPYLSDPTHYLEYTETIFAEEIACAGLILRRTTIRFGEIWAEVQSS